MVELLFQVLVVLLVVFWGALIGSLAFLIYSDAAQRGSPRPVVHGVFGGLFLAYTLAYLVMRTNIGDRSTPVTRGERIAGTVWIAGFGSVITGAVLSPPDPFTMIVYTFAGAPAWLLVGYVAMGRDGWLYRLRQE